MQTAGSRALSVSCVDVQALAETQRHEQNHSNRMMRGRRSVPSVSVDVLRFQTASTESVLRSQSGSERRGRRRNGSEGCTRNLAGVRAAGHAGVERGLAADRPERGGRYRAYEEALAEEERAAARVERLLQFAPSDSKRSQTTAEGEAPQGPASGGGSRAGS
jgi:hypothetical protein